MVRVVEQPVHETSIGDVIVGSVGLVGVLLIAAALLGLLLGGILIGVKKMRERYRIGRRPRRPLRALPQPRRAFQTGG